jgi:hypothetical protein
VAAVFLLFRTPTAPHHAARLGGPNTAGPPSGAPLEGLFNPVALAGTGTRPFVRTRATPARAANPVTASRDSPGGWDNHITDVDHYWKAVEYGSPAPPGSFYGYHHRG